MGMFTQFKNYVNKVTGPVIAGSLLGATSGAAGGIAGLNQMCSGNDGNMALDACRNYMEPLITPESQNAAMLAGLVAGAAIGFVAGSVAYPIFDGFSGWCYRNITRRVDRQVEQVVGDFSLDVRVERP